MADCIFEQHEYLELQRATAMRTNSLQFKVG